MRSLLVMLLLIAGPAGAAPVTIGQTDFPLGENAFPTGSACIDPGGCADDLLLLDSGLNPVPRPDALLGHDLSLVVVDMSDTDVFRLTFPQPIVNLDGDDLYLAQASFTGNVELEDGIHAMQVRFDDSPTWHTIPGDLDHFTEDPSAGAPIATLSDGAAFQVGYFLYFTKQDLSDFGFASGASIDGFDLRGEAAGGLDTVLAGNLNPVPEPGTCSLLAAGILGLACRRGRRPGAMA